MNIRSKKGLTEIGTFKFSLPEEYASDPLFTENVWDSGTLYSDECGNMIPGVPIFFAPKVCCDDCWVESSFVCVINEEDVYEINLK